MLVRPIAAANKESDDEKAPRKRKPAPKAARKPKPAPKTPVVDGSDSELSHSDFEEVNFAPG